MTTLISWLSVDSRHPSAVYIAADSRITWQSGDPWDFGRKVFACRRSPAIFGYVGDVLFPSLVLGQIASAIDDGLIYSESTSISDRAKLIYGLIRRAFRTFPDKQAGGFKIAYITREGEKMQSKFSCFSFELQLKKKGRKWTCQKQHIPTSSDSILAWGSGASSFMHWKSQMNESVAGGTSRAIFAALPKAILGGKDVCTGGAVQIVGIYRIGGGRVIGYVSDRRKNPVYLGMPLVGNRQPEGDFEWRDRLFQRCSFDGSLKKGAQEHRDLEQ